MVGIDIIIGDSYHLSHLAKRIKELMAKQRRYTTFMSVYSKEVYIRSKSGGPALHVVLAGDFTARGPGGHYEFKES